MLAYLVIREGAKWTDVYRLVPGRTVTIGRANTNEIVIKDEQCSRRHAEIFVTQGNWTLRDLDSRNGTLVGELRIRADYPLQPGDVVRIAHCQLAFVVDLAQAFTAPQAPAFPAAESSDGDLTFVGASASPPSEGVAIGEEDEASGALDLDPTAGTTITHRSARSRFHGAGATEDTATIPRSARAAAVLCRLAFSLAGQSDIPGMAKMALEGLSEGAPVDAGAVWLMKKDVEGELTPSDLEAIATRPDKKGVYHRVSDFLASTVLREGEGVLARNSEGDSTLGTRDSKGEIATKSVLCAPIRLGKRAVGFVHLYSTDAARVPDGEDLEFALAVADNLSLAVKNLRRQQELAENLNASKSELAQLRKRLGVESEIVGSSEAMMRVHQEIARAAPTRATVLIRGESGVGKELVARAVHYSSPRRRGPFVCLNCAALSETLLESELFGHEKGAFTGATERKVGKFESAHEGTLMLDEIGEMSPTIQAKFLRVLEGHPFERVGGSRPIKVDVRVIAATNRDLEKAVAAGEFRRDLYFRLHVVEVRVPPLRKRPEDISELAEHFRQKLVAETGRKLDGFTQEAVALLRQYRWPGNVRELRNVVERAVLLARGRLIQAEDLTLSNLVMAHESGEVPPANPAQFEPLTLDEVERRHILATLKATNWNKSRAAAMLGIERSTLDRKIRRHELRPSAARG